MGVKHFVAAGLPTGVLAGKVAGDDWRADHLRIPFEMSMFTASANAGVALLPASAALNTEVFSTSKATRNKIDLSQAESMRLTGSLIALGNAAGAAVKLDYMTAEAATWASTEMAGTLALGAGAIGAVFDTGWVSLPLNGRPSRRPTCGPGPPAVESRVTSEPASPRLTVAPAESRRTVAT